MSILISHYKEVSHLKKTYSRPTITSDSSIENQESAVPWVAAALLGGYVAGRAATKLMDARPITQKPSLVSRRKV